MPVYLRPMAPTAPDAILCGDPARALSIAQAVLIEPRMSNHHRGLWGYHGRTTAGRPLTVQATGIGAPSACAVFAELAAAGLRRAIRIGTCRGPLSGPAIGAALLADPVSGHDDGVTAGLDAEGRRFRPDRELAGRLGPATAGSMPLLSAGAVDWSPGQGPAGETGEQACLLDMQTAGLAAASAARGIPFAAVMIVASGRGGRLEDEPLEAVALRLATAAGAAFDPISAST